MTHNSHVSPKRLLLLLVPLIVVAAAVIVYLLNIESFERQRMEGTMLKRLGFGQPTATTLEKEYTDSNGDLLADPPTDETKWIDPETLLFSYIASSDESRQSKVWAEFVKQLGEAISRPVELVHVQKIDDQLAALREGKLHVTGFNTGSVPNAVCTAGFVPVCTLGRDGGEFGYRMTLLVPRESSIQKIEDLRGKKITFTRPGSNSGCKAAMELLARKFNMHPERDYEWGFSLGHDASIQGVAAGEFDAAPVASDLLERAIAEGTIEDDTVRSIHESERFPPAAIGYHSTLKPELAEKINAFLLSFDFSGTGLEEEFAPSGVTQFVPISYKDDWAIVRRIDEALASEGS